MIHSAYISSSYIIKALLISAVFSLFYLSLPAQKENPEKTFEIPCEEFKKGKFYYDTPDKRGIMIVRKKRKQKEINLQTGQKKIFKIEWDSTCAYTLTFKRSTEPSRERKGWKIKGEIIRTTKGKFKFKEDRYDIKYVEIARKILSKKERRELAEKREQERQDSIARAREDSIKQAFDDSLRAEGISPNKYYKQLEREEEVRKMKEAEEETDGQKPDKDKKGKKKKDKKGLFSFLKKDKKGKDKGKEKKKKKKKKGLFSFLKKKKDKPGKDKKKDKDKKKKDKGGDKKEKDK